MGTGNLTDDFKRDAVAQITERGYPVKEVSERLGVSKHSRYAWKRKFGKLALGDSKEDAEIRRLKRELLRVTEERDILKKVTASLPGMQSEIRVRRRAPRTILGSSDVPLPEGPAIRELCRRNALSTRSGWLAAIELVACAPVRAKGPCRTGGAILL